MMNDPLIELAGQALSLCLWLAAPVLGAMLIAGLIVGFLQAATQLQEPMIAFISKLAAAGVVLAAIGGALREKLIAFATLALSAAG